MRSVVAERSKRRAKLEFGQAEFVRDTVKRKVEKIGEAIALLPLLKDPQTEYVLLRSCLALPKISFLLRTVNTSYFASLLQ